MTDLFPRPPKANLPLSKGADLYVGFRNKTLVGDVWTATDYPDGTTVALTIEAVPPLVVNAVIVGSLATVWEQSEVVDTVKAGIPWRAVITYADGLDRVMCNGRTVRSDG
jgi:hypothetical protein